MKTTRLQLGLTFLQTKSVELMLSLTRTRFAGGFRNDLARWFDSTTIAVGQISGVRVSSPLMGVPQIMKKIDNGVRRVIDEVPGYSTHLLNEGSELVPVASVGKLTAGESAQQGGDVQESRTATGYPSALDAFITRSDSIHNGGLDKKLFILQRLLSTVVVRRRTNCRQIAVC